MDISYIKASFPVDEETKCELKELLNAAEQTDGYSYAQVLNEDAWCNAEAQGFLVLAYNDVTDQLEGVVSAIDMVGLNTYEWSMVVRPDARQQGIGTRLVEVTAQSFEERDARGELALLVKTPDNGSSFLEKRGYEYSFSEATLRARAVEEKGQEEIRVRLYHQNDREALIQLFMIAFGDLKEEAEALIEFNTTTVGRVLWVAEKDGKLVGTVTSVKGDNQQWVTALAVNVDSQKQGVGSALLTWVKNYAHRQGQEWVMLDVEIENAQALSIYKRASFEEVVQVDYFHKN